MKLRTTDKYFLLIVFAIVVFLFMWNIEFSKIYSPHYHLGIVFVDLPGPINIAFVKDYEFGKTTIRFPNEKVVDEARMLNDMGIVTINKLKTMNA